MKGTPRTGWRYYANNTLVALGSLAGLAVAFLLFVAGVVLLVVLLRALT